MEIPFRYRWSKWTVWRDLPLAAFLVGSLVAWGGHWVVMGNGPVASSLKTAICDLVSAASIAPTASPTGVCHQAPLITLARSPGSVTSQGLNQGLDFLHAAPYYNQLRYSTTTPPPFKTMPTSATAPSLTQIVDGAIAQLKARGLPTESVSLSLVDLTGDCCDYAAYQDLQPRYPASVVKLFWLVALYGHYEAGKLQPDIDVYVDDEALMAHYSNNGASSRVVDALTQTESGEPLDATALKDWMKARQTLNDYFWLADYPDLNIAHKTFPVPDLGMESRMGRDQQFAEGGTDLGPEHPLTRNFLTTATTARLLYEIDTGQAISPEYSDRIKQHLHHSTDPAVWQWEEDNAIAGFFGEYLPPDAQLYTKLGFTFDYGRQEAAIIASSDNQTRFVLVLFANDAVYSYQDETVFPTVARYVYDQMQLRQAPQ